MSLPSTIRPPPATERPSSLTSSPRPRAGKRSPAVCFSAARKRAGCGGPARPGLRGRRGPLRRDRRRLCCAVERVEAVALHQLAHRLAPRGRAVEDVQAGHAAVDGEQGPGLARQRLEMRDKLVQLRRVTARTSRPRRWSATRRPCGSPSSQSRPTRLPGPPGASRTPACTATPPAACARGPWRSGRGRPRRTRASGAPSARPRRTTPGCGSVCPAATRIVRLTMRFCLAPTSSSPSRMRTGEGATFLTRSSGTLPDFGDFRDGGQARGEGLVEGEVAGRVVAGQEEGEHRQVGGDDGHADVEVVQGRGNGIHQGVLSRPVSGRLAGPRGQQPAQDQCGARL